MGKLGIIRERVGRQDMRAVKYLLVALLVVVGLPAFVGGQVDPADAWERRLNELQPPDKVLEAVGVRPGMVIGEVGAGRGRYTVHLARGTGPEGRVYANDIDAGSLAYLRERCRRDGVGNVVTILGKMDDPLFPPSSLNLVFMVNTWHHLARPVVLLRNLIPALKPGAMVAIVEHDPEKSGAAFRREATSRETMLGQAVEAGFEVVRVETFLETDNIYILRPKAN
jgi:ubiquinone/menaquinone biosynthesis C-methylase UbiE